MEKDYPGLLTPVSRRRVGMLALLLALSEVFWDSVTGIRLNVAIIYALPLVVAAATRSRRFLWALVLFLLVTTFAVYSVQMPSKVLSLREPLFANRVLAALALVLTACLLHIGLVAVDLLEAQRRSLQERNEELIRRRREAEEASSRKMHLLAAASHDIRTPIHAISLLSEVLCRAATRPELADQVPDMAHRLQDNASALADLAGDLLDVARLDGTRVGLDVSEFALKDLLDRESALALPLARAKGLQLAVKAPDDAPWLRTDRPKLNRIVGNLLGNAIKYTDAGGVSLCAALTPDRAALIRVRDTGVGIDPEGLRRIFDEFVQLRNPEGDRARGCGLGLAICRRLAEAMGGTISVESEPGRGSTFTVRLPPSCVMDVSGGAPAPPECQRSDAGSGRAEPAVPHALSADGRRPAQ
jgi:signal transduction histidine kinase